VKIQIECASCRGTGVYQGFAEAPGTAVVCINCAGTGATTVEYKPYTGRKVKRGVKIVSYSRGSFIGLGVGAVEGSGMSYGEFRERVKEAKIKTYLQDSKSVMREPTWDE